MDEAKGECLALKKTFKILEKKAPKKKVSNKI